MKNLELILRLNAGFSTLSGLVMLLGSRALQGLFGFSNPWIFPVLGAGLVAFGAFVAYVSFRELENQGLVNLITALDGLWVLGSLLIIVFQLFNLSSAGYWIMGIVMLLIAFFAFSQYQTRE